MQYDNYYIENMGLIWEIIKLYQGETFKTKTGVPFTYKAFKDYITINESQEDIKKDYFKLACKYMPKLNIKEQEKITKGFKYIYAILKDDRINSNISTKAPK
jgi:hypothetical protein